MNMWCAVDSVHCVVCSVQVQVQVQCIVCSVQRATGEDLAVEIYFFESSSRTGSLGS